MEKVLKDRRLFIAERQEKFLKAEQKLRSELSKELQRAENEYLQEQEFLKENHLEKMHRESEVIKSKLNERRKKICPIM